VAAIGKPRAEGDSSRRSGRWRAAALTIGATPAAAVAAGTLAPFLDRLGPLCPLRRATGVPCPACGSTTAILALVGGRPIDAFAANPVTVAAVVGAVLWWSSVLVGGRAARAAGVARAAVAGVPRPIRFVSTGAVAAGSWLVQLHRFEHL
jgi:hypothetical protein